MWSCHNRHSAGGWSDGAKLAEKMQDVYEEVKLIPNKAKGFRDELCSSFWGVDLDGKRGLLRGSLKRAIPLAGLILKLVSVGHATADLMQIIVGSIISLFLYRRRLLSLWTRCSSAAGVLMERRFSSWMGELPAIC